MAFVQGAVYMDKVGTDQIMVSLNFIRFLPFNRGKLQILSGIWWF